MAQQQRGRTEVKNDDGWEDVSEEFQVKFDTDGDVFTGILTGLDQNGQIHQGHFEGTGEYAGEIYFINLGRDLQRKIANVPLRSEVRIVRTGTMDTGQQSPMVTYNVSHRKPR